MFTVLEGSHIHLQINVSLIKGSFDEWNKKTTKSFGTAKEAIISSKVVGKDLEGIYPFQLAFQDYF